MARYYVVGGQQSPDPRRYRNEATVYLRALVLEVDADSGAIVERLAYTTPNDRSPDRTPSHVFKAGTLHRNVLYLCTQTEVMAYEVPEFRLLFCHSLPLFNDIHHVLPAEDGRLLVANTGLDMVVELLPDGKAGRLWQTSEEPLWTRFSTDVDYRKVLSTKPHLVHPNFLFEHQGQVWVTRFEQRDIQTLTGPHRRIEIGGAPLHDGLVVRDCAYVTRVDGHVVRADLSACAVSQQWDLSRIHGKEGYSLGWCRGIEHDGDDRFVVGFSRIRPTRIHANLLWTLGKVGLRDDVGSLPTRIALYDFHQEALLWELDLEPAGLSAVFSIHRIGDT